MTEPFLINVGGRTFTTLKSTLEQSPFLAAMLSSQWAKSTCSINGKPFVDRSPVLFEHILDFLRSSVPPIFWTRTNGFDLALYASLLREAEYFHIETLAAWIRDEKYLDTIQIISLTEAVALSDCASGLTYSGDFEIEFEAGDGRIKGINSKRIISRKISLKIPVSDHMLLLYEHRD